MKNLMKPNEIFFKKIEEQTSSNCFTTIKSINIGKTDTIIEVMNYMLSNSIMVQFKNEHFEKYFSDNKLKGRIYTI